jgi:hypothetical protein
MLASNWDRNPAICRCLPPVKVAVPRLGPAPVQVGRFPRARWRIYGAEERKTWSITSHR